MLERRAEQHGAEQQQRDSAENFAQLLGEAGGLVGLLGDEPSEDRSRDERGDESRAAERDGDPVRETRAGDRDHLQPRSGDQVAPGTERDDRGGGQPGRDTADDPVADLLCHDR